MLNRDYIYSLMRERSWSQADLAMNARVSESAISRWLSGQRKSSGLIIQAMKRAFPDEKIEMLFLFGHSDA